MKIKVQKSEVINRILTKFLNVNFAVKIVSLVITEVSFFFNIKRKVTEIKKFFWCNQISTLVGLLKILEKIFLVFFAVFVFKSKTLAIFVNY